MYYEEKIINGVLMCRKHPDGQWQQVSIELLSTRFVQLQADRDALQSRVDALEAYVREILTDLRESAKADLWGIEDDLKTLEALTNKVTK